MYVEIRTLLTDRKSIYFIVASLLGVIWIKILKDKNKRKDRRNPILKFEDTAS